MLKMLYAGCPGPSSAISVQFTFKMSDAAGNRQKNY